MWICLGFLAGLLCGGTFLLHMRDEELKMVREENFQLMKENQLLKGEVMEVDYFDKEGVVSEHTKY